MKLLKVLPALISAVFLSATLGSVIYSESAVAEQKVSCAVSWNSKKDQVKDKDRRKYIACLEAVVGKQDKVCGLKTRKGQVKNKDRRRYIACLENLVPTPVAATPTPTPTPTPPPTRDELLKYKSDKYSSGNPKMTCPDGTQRTGTADMCGMMIDGSTEFCKDGKTAKAWATDPC